MYLVALVDLGRRFWSGVTLGSVFAPWIHVVISAGRTARSRSEMRTADPAPAEAHSAPDLSHRDGAQEHPEGGVKQPIDSLVTGRSGGGRCAPAPVSNDYMITPGWNTSNWGGGRFDPEAERWWGALVIYSGLSSLTCRVHWRFNQLP